MFDLLQRSELEELAKLNYRVDDPDFYFIQVGANDAKSGDPIFEYVHHFNWKGILLEPIPYLFDLMVENYKECKNLIFENAAIDAKDGTRALYRLKKSVQTTDPEWYEQLGSFSKEVISSHRSSIPDFDNHLVVEQVKCITFNTLLNRYTPNQVNLLVIDTEGYDFEVIKLALSAGIQPDMILYEHKHLDTADRRACSQLLTMRGYCIKPLTDDTFAYVPATQVSEHCK
jgi:FkbM family methyltransferase